MSGPGRCGGRGRPPDGGSRPLVARRAGRGSARSSPTRRFVHRLDRREVRADPDGTILLEADASPQAGSPFLDERPIQVVTKKKDFYDGVFEVTQKQRTAVVQKTPSYFGTCRGEIDDTARLSGCRGMKCRLSSRR